MFSLNIPIIAFFIGQLYILLRVDFSSTLTLPPQLTLLYNGPSFKYIDQALELLLLLLLYFLYKLRLNQPLPR